MGNVIFLPLASTLPVIQNLRILIAQKTVRAKILAWDRCGLAVIDCFVVFLCLMEEEEEWVQFIFSFKNLGNKAEFKKHMRLIKVMLKW